MKNCGLIFLLGLLAFVCNADIYRILDDEAEALQCRLDLIEQAEKEVLMNYFVLSDDLLGLRIFEALQNAAARGVQVKLIVDAKGSEDLQDKHIQYLRDRGVDIRIFNDKTLDGAVKKRLLRMHDKMLIVDSMSLITGGRNLRAKYFKMHPKGENFLDREVFIQGQKPINTGLAYFYSLWENDVVRVRETKEITNGETKTIAKNIANARAKVDSILGDSPSIDRDWAKGQKDVGTVEILHDAFVQPFCKTPRLTKQYIAMVDSARQSICIENPYFLPTKIWWSAFERAIERGVKIRVMVCSHSTNDEPIVQATYLNLRRKMVKAGFELWEYQGPGLLHSKCMVIDDSTSIIGSYNINKLSQYWTTEVMAVVHHKETALTHRKIMDENLKDCYPVNSKNKCIPNDSATSVKRPKYSSKVRLYRWTLCPLMRPFLR